MRTPADMRRLEELFNRATRLSRDERITFLEQLRASEPALCSELESLLEAHSRDGSFMDSPACEAAAEQIAGVAGAVRPGSMLGRYKVLSPIGSGGMGEVFLAEDSQLGRKVALKLLPAQYTDHVDRLRRFIKEAKAASALNHPNIITIHEIGDADGVHFIATEYVDGHTLRSRLERGGIEVPEALDIAIQVAAAIEAAHAAGIVHRDIKPENLMLRHDGYVKVLDFGLAKLTQTQDPDEIPVDSQLGTRIIEKTRPGTILGTPSYMSPEQARGREVDARSDIFSMGVVIYEMVTGHAPFTGETHMDVAAAILAMEPPSLTDSAPGVPSELVRIVDKALRKDMRERYQTTHDLLQDLKNLLEEIAYERLEESRGGVKADEARRQPGVAAPKASGSRAGLMAAIGALAVGIPIATWAFWPALSPAPGPAPAAPVADAAPVAERSLRYWIEVQKYRDGKPYQAPIRLRDDINFEQDYRLRLNISSAESGYLYLLNEGPVRDGGEPSFVVMYPTSPSQSARLEANQAVHIPEPGWFQFDEQQGTEKIWLVWARDAVDELEALKRFANATDKGLVTDSGLRGGIVGFLESHPAEATAVERDDTNPETSVRSRREILVHVIRLSHR